MPAIEEDIVIAPFTIVIDDREGAPYAFRGRLPCDVPDDLPPVCADYHARARGPVFRRTHHRPIVRGGSYYDLPESVASSDTDEPWSFEDLTTSVSQGSKRIVVRVETRRLPTGDYSIAGFEDRVTIERKSREDSYQTFGRERRRFEAELERMATYEYAAVLIEDTWEGIEHRPPRHTKMLPESMIESMVAWQQRYGVHFLLVSGRTQAEKMCFRLLRRFHRDVETKRLEAEKAAKKGLKIA